MPSELEKACLGCTLAICDDKSAECRFVQIKRSRPIAPVAKNRLRNMKRGRTRARLERQVKDDIIAILGRLIGEKAVDEARRRAAGMELINGATHEH